MSDVDIRALERAAATGDPGAAARLEREQVRAGAMWLGERNVLVGSIRRPRSAKRGAIAHVVRPGPAAVRRALLGDHVDGPGGTGVETACGRVVPTGSLRWVPMAEAQRGCWTCNSSLLGWRHPASTAHGMQNWCWDWAWSMTVATAEALASYQIGGCPIDGDQVSVERSTRIAIQVVVDYFRLPGHYIGRDVDAAMRALGWIA